MPVAKMIFSRYFRIAHVSIIKSWGGGRIPKKDNDNPENLVELLKEEVKNAYKLCLELEEENRKLQHEALILMKDMIIQLTSGGQ